MTTASGGTLLKLKAPPGAVPQVGGGQRGEVQTYSRASRKRLLEFFNSLDQTKIEHTPLFITLTYPAQYPQDTQETKAHLFAFIKRVIRRFPHASVVWRLEWQRRGAPHYHLLLFACPFLDYKDVANWWYDIVDSGDRRHKTAGTRVERIRGWSGIIFYASKYLGKVGAVPAGVKPGRLWGVVNRQALPRTLLVRTLDWRTFFVMRRVVWQRAEKFALAAGRKSWYCGMTVFMPTNDAIRLFEQARHAA